MISIARLFSPFFFISIVRCTYWYLLLRPLPRSSLYQKGIIRVLTTFFVNIIFFLV